jgi:hypothetical protein
VNPRGYVFQPELIELMKTVLEDAARHRFRKQSARRRRRLRWRRTSWHAPRKVSETLSH